MVDICLKGMYICARHVVPILKAKGNGKIVNIASIAGHRGMPGGSAHWRGQGWRDQSHQADGCRVGPVQDQCEFAKSWIHADPA